MRNLPPPLVCTFLALCLLGSPLTAQAPATTQPEAPAEAPAAGPAEDPPGTVHPELWPSLTSALPADPAIERAIGELLATMSLEEQVGQVMQPSIQHVTPADVKEYHLGSVPS